MPEPKSSTNAIIDLLSGFHFVESDGAPSVTLDNQRRFYLNATTRKMLGVKPYDRLAIAYNDVDKALAIVKPDAIGSALFNDASANASRYFVSQRYYLSARHFSRANAYPPEKAPYHFDYDRGSSDGSVFIFRLRA